MMAGKWRWKSAQFIERRWWQRYLKNRNVKDYLNWKTNFWQNLLAKCHHYFNIPTNANILDAGCGPAGIFIALPSHRVTAFDPLIDKYEKDLAHFKKSDYPTVIFFKAGLEDFQIDQPFDIIFCMNAINHVFDIAHSFDQLVRMGKSGSHLVVTIDAHNHTLIKKLFQAIPGDILHPHQYDLNEYQRMLTSRGCELIGTELLKHTFLFDHYMLIARKK